MIYLDYAANSPVDKKVLDVFYETSLKYYANPNSEHKLGRQVNEIIDNSTINIASYFNASKEEVIYTSGASESNNLAVRGICERYKNKGKHILLTALEHTSIIAPANVMQEQGFEVEVIPLDNNGRVDLEKLKELIREDTILVSVTSVDSELGIIQPVEEIANIVSNYPNCFFHTDASQSIGKVKIDFSKVSLITVSPHKFYGLNGFGLLIKRNNVHLKPIIYGGKSTTIYRSGTPEVANILALEKALELAVNSYDYNNKYITNLNSILRNALSNYKNVVINSNDYSVPNILNISIKKVKIANFMKKLEENEVYLSTKAACCPTNTPSRVVYALSKSKEISSSSLRISLSHLIKEEEINNFIKIFDKCYKEL